MTKDQVSELIKQKALDLGFSACGIAKAEPVSAEAVAEMENWLAEGKAAGMDYLHRNKNLRYDPRELFPGAKSLIVVAMNYFPRQKMESDVEFAYYSYGKDYHFVLKSYLAYLFKYIEEIFSAENPTSDPAVQPFKLEGRAFTDSAPLMEQYWAVQAGIGFRGRNTLLIVPRVGSFCFLGVLAVNIELAYDSPKQISCGTCRRCEEACPTHAICNKNLDASRCISYHTIESRAETIPDEIAEAMGNKIFGCDECQKNCPWNIRFASPTPFDEFNMTDILKNFSSSELENMSNNEFKRNFKSSPILRLNKKKLVNNILSVKKLSNRQNR